MEIERREKGEVVILDIKGKMALGYNEGKLKEEINFLLKNGEKRILLNLSQVSYMDSTGVGELVISFREAKREGAVIKIVNVGNKIYRTLTITRLLPIFEVFSAEEEALKSFGK
jgi:anti-sigma B factor antagonist